MNYGDFVDSTTDATEQPYVQLLPLTDAVSAAADFIAIRDAAPPYNGYASLVNQFLPVFIALPVFGLICIVSLFVWLHLRKRNADTRNMIQLP
jgi:hypothetical protein